MEQTLVEQASLVDTPAYNLTIWGLISDADLVVQVVLVILLLASFWTWAIIFEKMARLRRLRSRSRVTTSACVASQAR